MWEGIWSARIVWIWQPLIYAALLYWAECLGSGALCSPCQYFVLKLWLFYLNFLNKKASYLKDYTFLIFFLSHQPLNQPLSYMLQLWVFTGLPVVFKEMLIDMLQLGTWKGPWLPLFWCLIELVDCFFCFLFFAIHLLFKNQTWVPWFFFSLLSLVSSLIVDDCRYV